MPIPKNRGGLPTLAVVMTPDAHIYLVCGWFIYFKRKYQKMMDNKYIGGGEFKLDPDYYEMLIDIIQKCLLLESSKKSKGRHATVLHCVIKSHYIKTVKGLSDRVHIGLEYIPDGLDGPYVMVIDDNDIIESTGFQERCPEDFNDLVTGLGCLYRVELDGTTLYKHHLLTGNLYEDMDWLNNCVHNLYSAIVVCMEKISYAYGATLYTGLHSGTPVSGPGGFDPNKFLSEKNEWLAARAPIDL